MFEFQSKLNALYFYLRKQMKNKYNRHVSFGDCFTDRWDRAKFLGFGDGTSCYDNVLVIGDVQVGNETWIGPNTVLDGSGGLKIGSHCSISAGAQIYSHNTVSKSTSMGVDPIEYDSTFIGDGVYIGPQAVIQKGVRIGDRAIIGAMAFVNTDVPAGFTAYGIPAKVLNRV